MCVVVRVAVLVFVPVRVVVRVIVCDFVWVLTLVPLRVDVTALVEERDAVTDDRITPVNVWVGVHVAVVDGDKLDGDTDAATLVEDADGAADDGALELEGDSAPLNDCDCDAVHDAEIVESCEFICVVLYDGDVVIEADDDVVNVLNSEREALCEPDEVGMLEHELLVVALREFDRVSALDADDVSVTDDDGVPVRDDDGVSVLDDDGVSVREDDGASDLDEVGVSVTDDDGESVTDDDRVPVLDDDGVSVRDDDGVSVWDDDGVPVRE